MTGAFGADPPGATPLTDDDVEGLKATWVATRADLDQAEADNIGDARLWARRRRWKQEDLLSAPALLRLHKRMFGDVWNWAGAWRTHVTNLGEDWWNIPTLVPSLCLDVLAQVDSVEVSGLTEDEIAVAFHHRLVCIHPFANGNGRHARMAAELLVSALGLPLFTWGRSDLNRSGQQREIYLQALRVADHELDYGPLLTFARS